MQHQFSILVFCVDELTVYCCIMFFVFYLLPQSLSFCREMWQKDSSLSHAAGQCLWKISAPSWNASAQLVKLCTPQCAWLKPLAFAEVGKLTSSWHKNTYCCRATVVCLDTKRLWKPRQSFILAGFTFSLPCSALGATGQTTIDTGLRLQSTTHAQLCWLSTRLQPLQKL